MGTAWDRAAEGYVREWVPRFEPYHLDLVRALGLSGGEQVLVTSAGPGAEIVPLARAIGAKGRVRATDPSESMVRLCRELTARAQLETPVEVAVADGADTSGGEPWDAVVNAFGFWQLRDRVATLRAWGQSLAPHGMVGLIAWGPEEPTDPFDMLRASLRQVEPAMASPITGVRPDREGFEAMLGESGLTIARHAVVRHPMTFATASAFVGAMRDSCAWRAIHEELGDERFSRVAEHFYARVGGPAAPLRLAPPATVVIASRA
jgi:threonine dehydrogenase-like Zn-dependent dehydrogenase